MGRAWRPSRASPLSTRPRVANGRGPYRSASRPASGPEMKKPTVSGIMAMPAHSGVRSKL